MDDLSYERHLNRKAQRFGMAVVALGVLMLVYSLFDPTFPGLQAPPIVIHLIDAAFAVALIVEGIRRIALGRAPEEEEEGIFGGRSEANW